MACLVLTALILLSRDWILPHLPPLLSLPLMMWIVFLFFLVLALIEIPVMVYGLRKIGEGKSTYTEHLVLGGNAFFVFFPVVYAAPNLLLSPSAQLWMGVVISATAFLRFASSIFYLFQE